MTISIGEITTKTGFIEIHKMAGDKQNMHCEHYNNNCLVRFECCRNMYPCRLCHDKHETHKANRYEIRQMLCKNCNTLQAKAQFCVQCSASMSKYFCPECNLWDSSDDRIFHCDKCNVCRRGDKEVTFHCEICQTCLIPLSSEKHIHVENTTGGNCPICAENMSESTDVLILLMCGHSLHEVCFNKFIKETCTCPICMKSIGDTSVMNKKIEHLLEMESCKEKLGANNIRCHDCSNVCEGRAGFIYNKCSFCNSYNTRATDGQ